MVEFHKMHMSNLRIESKQNAYWVTKDNSAIVYDLDGNPWRVSGTNHKLIIENLGDLDFEFYGEATCYVRNSGVYSLFVGNDPFMVFQKYVEWKELLQNRGRFENNDALRIIFESHMRSGEAFDASLT